MNETHGKVAWAERLPSAAEPETSSPLRWLVMLTVSAVVIALGVYFYRVIGFDLHGLRDAAGRTPPILFFAAMALLPVVGFPIAVFYLFAGATYSWPLALAICWGALGINLTLSWWLAAKVLRPPILRWLTRRGYRVPTLQGEQRWRAIFLLRTIPGPPFPVQNYLLALAGVPFAEYLWISWFAQGMLATGMIWAAKTFASAHGQARWWIVALLFACIPLIKGVRRWRAGRLKNASARAKTSE